MDSLNRQDSNVIDANLIIEEDDNQDLSIPAWKRFFSPITQGSERGCIMSLVATTIGTGCLAFPFAINRIGVVPGLAVMILVGSTMYYTLRLLLQSSLNTNTFDYNKLIRLSLGNFWLIIYDISCFFYIIGIMMAYQSTSSQLIIQVIEEISNILIIKYKWLVMLISCVCIQIPLCSIRKIGKLQYPSIIAAITYMIIALIFTVELFFYIKKGLSPGSNYKIDWFGVDHVSNLYKNIFQVFAVFMYGYSNHNALLPILSGLRKPNKEKFTKVINYSFSITSIIFFIMAFSGYFSVPINTPPIINTKKTHEEGNDYVMLVVNIFLIVCLHCLLPVRWNILRDSIKALMKVEELSMLINIIMTIISLTIMNTAVYFISFTEVISFVGGLFTVMICYFIPLFDYTAVSGKRRWQSILGYIILGLFSIIGATATVMSFLSIINNLDKVSQ